MVSAREFATGPEVITVSMLVIKLLVFGLKLLGKTNGGNKG